MREHVIPAPAHEVKEVLYQLAELAQGQPAEYRGASANPLSPWAVSVYCSLQLVVNLPFCTPAPPPRNPLPGSDTLHPVCAIHRCAWADPALPSVSCPRNWGNKDTLALALMLLSYLLNCVPWLWFILKS